MPPLYPLLKNDGPPCRACGCTEHNACLIEGRSAAPIAKGVRMPAVRMPRVLTCSWVKVEGATPPLCSACSGTEADMAEAIARSCRLLEQSGQAGVHMAVIIGKAALARRKRRGKAEKGT